MTVAAGTTPAPFEGILAGKWSAAYGERYDRALPLRPAAAALWDLLRYLLFREASTGVLVGEEDWLFTTEEFAVPETKLRTLTEQLDLVREVDGALESRGIGLVVVVVPAKARIYPDMLGRYVMPGPLKKRYGAIQRGLAGRGVSNPDLLSVLVKARAHDPVFLRTDTHWTPYGAWVAAEASTPAVIEVLERAESPRISFAAAAGEVEDHRGDLLNFIRLGPRLARFGPSPDTVRPILAVQQQSPTLGLFDDVTIPVVLVGTSYSAGPLWSFDSALKVTLQADVLNVAETGRGPFEPMQELLGNGVLADVQADVVIWEIPERYFLFPP
jgi:alginate O-acetyltransferase complex protein AlgJ